jgi:site-specific DNA-methyltransferase (adenine-specific)
MGADGHVYERMPVHQTNLGRLYQRDCLGFLRDIPDKSCDTFFADPPFNLSKDYGPAVQDNRHDDDYVTWCKDWLNEAIRVTADGGAIFVYNLPKWNIHIGHHLLSKGLNFRHAIAVESKTILPIQGRLYPAHYSLLYFTVGKPKTFRKIRTPMEICRHCGGEIKDYGGHRKAMNPSGVNLKDIWSDIPPVRHKKFKPVGRAANALSTKLLDRVVEMTTAPMDLVVDPFGGSGTTYAVCEKKRRRWLGCEIGDVGPIIHRLTTNDVCHHHNSDLIESDSCAAKDIERFTAE